MAATENLTGEELERKLEELLDQEYFEPPEEFTKNALLSDPSIYEEAEKDWKAWWLKQATENLDWETEPQESVDDSNPPFYKWFADGELNVSYNCLDRHVEAGNGDRVAYHWHGEEGETRADHLRRTPGRRAEARQRPEVARHREGRRRRHLPADDPRGRRLDARLRAHRRPAQRRVRRLLRRLGPGADGGLGGQGAHHRRRRPAQGQDRAGEADRRRGDRRARLPAAHRRRAGHRHRLRR